jgi:CDP-diacylglycerol--glycerol-3-phosphate 3-phosphatidyltransferase
MSFTASIGSVCDKILSAFVHGLNILRITPNTLTLIGVLINVIAAWILASGNFFVAGLVIVGAGVFDMVDGRVARTTGQVTRFGAFFDSVMDRYSDLLLLSGLLVYYASINRSLYIALTAVAMVATVLVSYSRARSENVIPKCKVGFMERPERIVLLVIGALFNRMAPVLWVIAVLGNLTVIHRIVHTWSETKKLEGRNEPKPEAAPVRSSNEKAEIREQTSPAT